jgi:hypothetical protein
VVAVAAIIAGILVAAALDHRLGWGTSISVALAIYCHRLYRQPTSPRPPAPAVREEDELRPGWAARWGREPSTASGSGHVLGMGGTPVAAGARAGTSLGRNRHE